jgi:hypothetical protein
LSEGPTEIVKEQFAAFRELVAAVPVKPAVIDLTHIPPTPLSYAERDLPVIRDAAQRRSDCSTRSPARMAASSRSPCAAHPVEDEIKLVMLRPEDPQEQRQRDRREIIDGLRLTGRTMRRVDYQFGQDDGQRRCDHDRVGRARRIA